MTAAQILPSMWATLGFAAVFITLGIGLGAILWHPTYHDDGLVVDEDGYCCDGCGIRLSADAYAPQIYCSPTCETYTGAEAAAQERAEGWLADEAERTRQ